MLVREICEKQSYFTGLYLLLVLQLKGFIGNFKSHWKGQVTFKEQGILASFPLSLFGFHSTSSSVNNPFFKQSKHHSRFWLFDVSLLNWFLKSHGLTWMLRRAYCQWYPSSFWHRQIYIYVQYHNMYCNMYSDPSCLFPRSFFSLKCPLTLFYSYLIGQAKVNKLNKISICTCLVYISSNGKYLVRACSM